MQDYQKRRRFIRKPIPIMAYQTFDPVSIQTREGVLKANAGDWVVTGVKGERYIMTNEIFMETYERLDD